MWLLMSRLVDTPFLIAHWGFPSFHLGHWHDWLDWSIILIGDSDIVIFFVLHWYICLRYLTCWLWWLIRIDRGFRDSYFSLCFIDIFIWDFDMLIILIDHFVLLTALILILPWLFWSLHMRTLTAVHHSAGYVVFSDWHIILIVFWAWCSYRYSSW